MKILFFIGNLRSGGKERRLVELMKAIRINNENIELCLVLIRNDIHYKEILDWDISIEYFVEKNEAKKPLTIYKSLYKIIKDYKPDIIHSWGSEETFYIFSIAKSLKIKLINSQITDAPNKINWFSKFGIQTKINFLFSDVILANSYAGLKSYNIENSNKSKVIYNGFDIARIQNLKKQDEIRNKFKLHTKFIIAMVASFSDKKDYKTYIQAAISVLENRKDVISTL